jgi:Domain of unknown function (DUF3841)
MEHRLPTARRRAVTPVWAWLRWSGNSARPDLRTPGHVPSGTRAVRLEFLTRADDILCSDFEAWHFALNYWYQPDPVKLQGYYSDIAQLVLLNPKFS